MTRLPQISGKALIRALGKVGYQVVRQEGSHVRLYPTDKSKRKITIPNHKILGKGLLTKILRDAEISVDDLRKFL
jgi:predicted RNA binding protein YcfA (HicA-like mRNA interferase family)